MALLLLVTSGMTARNTRNEKPYEVHTAPAKGSKGSIVVVGGSGGMSDRYREIAEDRGLELRHFEKRVPNGTRRILGKVAAVFVIVGMVSHSLRDQIKDIVPEEAPIVYLRTASVSALRNAVAALDANDSDSNAT